MSALTLDPATTALVVIDLQRGIVGIDTAPHAARDVLVNSVRIAKRFRERHGSMSCWFAWDPGPHWELFPRTETDVPRPARTGTMPADWSEIVPELGPDAHDVVVTKHQPGAFFGTDLDVQISGGDAESRP